MNDSLIHRNLLIEMVNIEGNAAEIWQTQMYIDIKKKQERKYFTS